MSFPFFAVELQDATQHADLAPEKPVITSPS